MPRKELKYTYVSRNSSMYQAFKNAFMKQETPKIHYSTQEYHQPLPCPAPWEDAGDSERSFSKLEKGLFSHT